MRYVAVSRKMALCCRRFLVLHLLLIVWAMTASALTGKSGESDIARVNRLVGLCKLWGQVKFFHPQIAYGDIDWDKALIDAVPGVIGSQNAEEYEQALSSMLAGLGDPSTRVIRSETPDIVAEPNEDGTFRYSMAPGGVLVISAHDYFLLYSSESQDTLSKLLQRIPDAKAIVFDLRTNTPPTEYGNGALRSSLSRAERLISSINIATPGERSRLYYGYENANVFSSGQYRSGFYLRDGQIISPLPGAKDIPSVFVLNKNSGILPSMLPLQALGKALILFEGSAGEEPVGKFADLDLPDGLRAHVRLNELVYKDGSIADVVPDSIIKTSKETEDRTLWAAISLALNFKPSSVVHQKLPASGVFSPEKSYRTMKYPSREYRLLAAFRIWNIVEYFFPYRQLIGRNWEDVLRDFIPKFEHSQNSLEYSLTVAEMLTEIHDSHVYTNGEALNEYFGDSYPPVRVRIIQNEPVITAITDDSARSAGLSVGDIVLKVDGENASARIERYAKYISAATPQSKMYKAGLAFMNGKDGSTVTLTVRDRENREKQARVTRKYEDYNSLYHRERSGETIRLLPGNIGYADLDRLGTDKIDQMLERFKNTRGIVFDMRGYPNGDFYWLLSPRLATQRNTVATLLETPLVGQNSSDRSFEAFNQVIQSPSPNEWIYKGRTVMLIDERSVSQSEHTGLFFKAANGTTFVGSATAGTDGEIATFVVPGGITIGFSGQSVRFPDGKQLQRVGLRPDIEVRPTIEGIRNGRDEVLEKAVQYLQRLEK